MRPAFLIAIAMTASSVPALAQDRTADMREALVGLTRVLGESHALRQACGGSDDQYWRVRMNRLLETETPDEELEGRMKASFNAGFADTRRLYPFCGDGARQAQGLAAARGQELSTSLSHARYRTGVAPVIPEEEGVTAEPAPR